MEVVQQADAVAEVVGKCYVYLSLFKHHVYHLDIGGVLTALVVKDVSYKGIDKRAVGHGVKGLDDKTGAVKVGVCGGNGNAFDIAVNRCNIVILVEVILGGITSPYSNSRPLTDWMAYVPEHWKSALPSLNTAA